MQNATNQTDENPPPEGLRQHIQGSMDAMSHGEKKVARALLANYPSAGLTTVAELAVAAKVSSPTVIRCVNRIGFSGFPVFQRQLIVELNEHGSPLKQYGEKRGKSSSGSLISETRESYVDMLDKTFEQIPESEFASLVKTISDARKRIRVTGGRFSGFLAEYMLVHLRMLRPDVHLVRSDDMDQRAAITDTDESTVLVVLDFRRYTAQSRVLAERMHQRGATVCLLTDNWLSPISSMSRIVLPSHVDSASPFDSLVAATAVVESIIAGVTDRLGENGRRRVAQTESSLDDP